MATLLRSRDTGVDCAPWELSFDAGLCLIWRPTNSVVMPRSRRARAILAYLAMSPTRRATRNQLISLLWASRGPQQARSSLRQAIMELRRLGEPTHSLIDADRDHVWLRTEAVDIMSNGHPCDPFVLVQELEHITPQFDRWLSQSYAPPSGKAKPLYLVGLRFDHCSWPRCCWEWVPCSYPNKNPTKQLTAPQRRSCKAPPHRGTMPGPAAPTLKPLGRRRRRRWLSVMQRHACNAQPRIELTKSVLRDLPLRTRMARSRCGLDLRTSVATCRTSSRWALRTPDSSARVRTWVTSFL